MGKRIRIKTSKIEASAELNDTRTAQSIWEALPLKGFANLWGDEIYFSIPLILPSESGKEFVNIGDLGYWPQGNAFCIFFGPTPISKEGKIKPASAVNVFGKISGDADIFKQITSGTKIVIEQESDEETERQSKALLIQDYSLAEDSPSLEITPNIPGESGDGKV